MMNLSQQISTIIFSLFFGMIVLFVYQILNRLLLIFNNFLIQLIGEMLYFVCSTLIFYFILVQLNNGVLSYYYFILIMIGAIIYYKSFGYYTLSLVEKIAKFIENIIRKTKNKIKKIGKHILIKISQKIVKPKNKKIKKKRNRKDFVEEKHDYVWKL